MGILKKNYNNSGRMAAMIGLDEAQDQDDLLGGMEEPEIVGPISIYSVTGTDFDQKTFQGLRYLIWDNGKDMALKSADVDVDADDEDSTVPEDAFVSLTSGLPVTLLGEALLHAEEEFSSASEGFEVSIVEIPSANTSAIWVRGESSEFFIPYLDPKHLSREQPTTIDDKFENKISNILAEIKVKRGFLDER